METPLTEQTTTAEPAPLTPEERAEKWAPMVEDLEPGADHVLICFVLEEEVRFLIAEREEERVFPDDVQKLIFPTIRRALAYYRPEADAEQTLRNLVSRAHAEVSAAVQDMGEALPSMPLTYLKDLQDRVCKGAGLYLTTVK